MDHPLPTPLLCPKSPLPVEVIQYSHNHIRRKLERLPSLRGCEAVLRLSKKQAGIPFVTDNGNYIVDLKFR